VSTVLGVGLWWRGTSLGQCWVDWTEDREGGASRSSCQAQVLVLDVRILRTASHRVVGQSLGVSGRAGQHPQA
jgi:hypothetical protein